MVAFLGVEAAFAVNMAAALALAGVLLAWRRRAMAWIA